MRAIADFTLVIPCYNRVNLIAKTLSSVKRQRGFDVQVIVVDDASTDGTLDMARKEMKEARDCLFLRHKENRGHCAARNTGLKEASGRYISFLDSDDMIAADFVKQAVARLDATGCDIWGCGYQVVDRAGKELQRRKPRLSKSRNWSLDYLKGTMKLHLCGTVFRSEFLKRHDLAFTEGRSFAGDQEFLVKALARANRGEIDCRPLYYYVQHEGQITRAGRIRECYEAEMSVFSSLLSDYAVKENAALSTFIERVELPRVTLSFLKNLARAGRREDFFDEIKNPAVISSLRNNRIVGRRSIEVFLKTRLLLNSPGCFYRTYERR